MPGIIGEAFIAIRPISTGFAPELQQQMSMSTAAAGRTAGKALNAELGAASAVAGKKVGKNLEKEAAPSGAKAGKAAGMSFGKTMFAAVAAVGAFKFLSSTITEAREAEKAQIGLQAAYQKFPAMANVSFQSFNKLNAEMMRKVKFDDEALASGEAILAQFKLTGTQIQQLIPLIADYAARTGTDIPEAATAIGRALLGNTRALKTVGIQFQATGDIGKDFGTIYDALSAKVGGFAEKEGKTASGRMDIMKNQFKEMKEAIGGALIPILATLMGVLAKLANFIERNISWLKPFALALTGVAVAVYAINKAMMIWNSLHAAAKTLGTLFSKVLGGQAMAMGALRIATLGAASAVAILWVAFSKLHAETQKNQESMAKDITEKVIPALAKGADVAEAFGNNVKVLDWQVLGLTSNADKIRDVWAAFDAGKASAADVRDAYLEVANVSKEEFRTALLSAAAAFEEVSVSAKGTITTFHGFAKMNVEEFNKWRDETVSSIQFVKGSLETLGGSFGNLDFLGSSLGDLGQKLAETTVNKAITSASGALEGARKIEAAAANRLAQFEAKLHDKKKITAADLIKEKELQEALAVAQDNVSKSTGRLSSAQNTYSNAAAIILKTFDDQLRAQQTFSKTIDALMKRKIPPDLLNQLMSMGKEGQGIMNALANSNNKQWRLIMADWKKGEGQASLTSKSILVSFEASLQAQIKYRENVDTLLRRKIPQDMLLDLVNKGEQGKQVIAGLATANEADWKRIVGAWQASARSAPAVFADIKAAFSQTVSVKVEIDRDLAKKSARAARQDMLDQLSAPIPSSLTDKITAEINDVGISTPKVVITAPSVYMPNVKTPLTGQSGPYSGRQIGGSVREGMIHIVGEAGPELRVERRGAEIITNQGLMELLRTISHLIDFTNKRPSPINVHVPNRPTSDRPINIRVSDKPINVNVNNAPVNVNPTRELIQKIFNTNTSTKDTRVFGSTRDIEKIRESNMRELIQRIFGTNTSTTIKEFNNKEFIERIFGNSTRESNTRELIQKIFGTKEAIRNIFTKETIHSISNIKDSRQSREFIQRLISPIIKVNPATSQVHPTIKIAAPIQPTKLQLGGFAQRNMINIVGESGPELRIERTGADVVSNQGLMELLRTITKLLDRKPDEKKQENNFTVVEAVDPRITAIQISQTLAMRANR